MNDSIIKYKLFWISVLAVIAISSMVACGRSDDWCIGKWSGHLKSNMYVEYVIKIREDHTCTVKSEWFWGNTRSADFEAEWEPVSKDVIKIFDYDGHNENWNGFRGINQRRVGRWSMYLRKDGSCSYNESTLDNPEGYLKKQK